MTVTFSISLAVDSTCLRIDLLANGLQMSMLKLDSSTIMQLECPKSPGDRCDGMYEVLINNLLTSHGEWSTHFEVGTGLPSETAPNECSLCKSGLELVGFHTQGLSLLASTRYPSS